ncbi:MAG: adenylate kinase family protein [Microcoleaceae cyanobacterium]
MRLTILGGPGAGKSVQAQLFGETQGIPLLAIGEVLRQEVAQTTPLGQLAQPYVESGGLVPDEIMIKFVRKRLLQDDVSHGWLLEGYPRTAFQAEELDFLLSDLGQHLDYAIYLKVDDRLLMGRSLVRCRVDDTPDAIQNRIEAFKERTIPLLEYYEHRQNLLVINGDRSIAEINQDICQILENKSISK